MIYDIGRHLICDIWKHRDEVLTELPVDLDGGWNRIVNYVGDNQKPTVTLGEGAVMKNCNIEGGVSLGANSSLLNCYVSPNVDLFVGDGAHLENVVFEHRTDDNEGRFCEPTRAETLVRTVRIGDRCFVKSGFFSGNVTLGKESCVYNSTFCTGYDPRLHLEIGEACVAKDSFFGFCNENEATVSDDTSVCMGVTGSHLMMLNATVLFNTIEFELGEYAMFARWRDVLELLTGDSNEVNEEKHPQLQAFRLANGTWIPQYYTGLSPFQNGYHPDNNAAFDFTRDTRMQRGQHKFQIGDHFCGVGIWRINCNGDVQIGDNVTLFHMASRPIKIGCLGAHDTFYIGRGATIFESTQDADSSGRTLAVDGLRICSGAKVDVTGNRYRSSGLCSIEINSTDVTEI